MAEEVNKNEEIEETQAAAESKAETTEQAPVDAEREALIQQLKEAESKMVEYKDGWARSQAEFQNFRKRMERDNDTFKASTKGDIFKNMCQFISGDR